MHKFAFINVIRECIGYSSWSTWETEMHWHIICLAKIKFCVCIAHEKTSEFKSHNHETARLDWDSGPPP